MITRIPTEAGGAVAPTANATPSAAGSDLFAALLALIAGPAPPAAEPLPAEIAAETAAGPLEAEDESTDESADEASALALAGLTGVLGLPASPAPATTQAVAGTSAQAESEASLAPAARLEPPPVPPGPIGTAEQKRAGELTRASIAADAASPPAVPTTEAPRAASARVVHDGAPPPVPARAPDSPIDSPVHAAPRSGAKLALGGVAMPRLVEPGLPELGLEPVPVDAAESSGTAEPEPSLAPPQGISQPPIRDAADAPARAQAQESARPVVEKIAWLAEQGGGSARIELSPPELGHVEIVVRVRGRRVEVHVRAVEAAAQQVVRDGRERLVDALASRDLAMDGFSVNGEASGSSGFGSREPTPETRDTSFRNAFGARSPSAPASPKPAPDRSSANGAIDLRV